MKRATILPFIIFALTSVCVIPVQAQISCSVLTNLSFTNPSLESGSNGNVGATYRFTNVMSGVDAKVRITAKSNTSLVSIDLTGTGEANRWQPQVEIDRFVSEGYMDFDIDFVISGTHTPITVIDWYASAVDVDGDDGAIRESVGFVGVDTWALEDPTNLEEVSGPSDMKLFQAKTSANREGIEVSATEHLVYTTYRNKSSFGVRTRILSAFDSRFSARDRMFSFSFNPCVFAEFDNPGVFPVEWLTFSGDRIKEGVMIHWITTQELNNDYFLLQRSYDGINYETIEQVKGQGLSERPVSYTTVDEGANFSTLYYRLEQVDLDGSSNYSNVIQVEALDLPLDGAVFQTFPNPTTDYLNVTLNHGESIEGIKIMDIYGREVYKEFRTQGGRTWEVALSHLPTGSYAVQLYHQLHWTPARKFLKQ